jgi:hypothetical protein
MADGVKPFAEPRHAETVDERRSKMKGGAVRIGLLVTLAAGFVAFGSPRSPPIVKVGECSYDLLVGRSDRIVLARVDRIEAATDDSAPSDSRKLELAHATVLETWKGKAEEPLVYRCSSSWTCDITAAKVGEVAVLLLDSETNRNWCVVMDSGRGRMPVTESKGERFATLWVGDVELPLDTETSPGPDERYDFIRNVKLDTLRSVTKALIARRAKLSEMVAKSDTIVVGTIQRVRSRRSVRSIDSFTLSIEEQWKGGGQEATFEIRRPPAWPLDVEPMQPGQRALFFLMKPREDGARDLVEDGRGRMVLESVDDRRVAKIWVHDVEMPSNLPVEEVLDAHEKVDPLWRHIEAVGLKRFVTNRR